MDHSEMRTALDACRPGSDDLHLPEFASMAECLEADPIARRHFDRMQRFDMQVAEATHDVAVPAGLAERILARIEASASAAAPESTIAETAAPAAAANPGSAPAPLGRRRFRRWTWSLVALAASLLLAVSLVTFWPHGRVLTVEGLKNDSITWYTQLWDQGAWVPLGPRERERPAFPVGSSLRVVPRQWSDATSIVGESAAAYDLTTGGHQAALFVIPSGTIDVGSIPPFKPSFNTGGLMIGCWQAHGMVYVLVVKGDERAYQNLLESVSQPPLA